MLPDADFLVLPETSVCGFLFFTEALVPEETGFFFFGRSAPALSDVRPEVPPDGRFRLSSLSSTGLSPHKNADIPFFGYPCKKKYIKSSMPDRYPEIYNEIL